MRGVSRDAGDLTAAPVIALCLTRLPFRAKVLGVQCASCGGQLLPGKKFCPACGTRVVLTCARCGAAVDPEFRFCPDCGAPMAAPTEPAPGSGVRQSFERLAPQMPEGLVQKIQASKDAIVGERKQVTVLFCDLVGSTAIAEKLDPEEYRELLDQYLEIAFREIYRFEGIVNQLAGDGMMALFGAPIAHEDAPQRAVLAALAIREALAVLNAELRAQRRNIELQARFGINTGPVVAGTVGNDLKMDYTAIGDTTNLAARLEALAGPAAVLVSEATYRLVRGLFEVRNVGPFTVKGKREPVIAFEILGRSEETAPMAIAAERGLTPFVGRDEEMAQLRACYERLVGHLPQVVAVVGDAGCGKSRLIYEFRRWLAQQPAVVFEARCSALNQMVPYYPWIAMLKQYFGVASNEPAASGCEKISAKLRTLSPELAAVAPLLCHLLGAPVRGLDERPMDEFKRDIFEAVSQLIETQAQSAPVVMIIEDLHWIDEPSREMLERAVTRFNHGRAMLLVSHRPDYHQTWRASAAFTQLNLRSLRDTDTREIIHALAGASLPMELEALILAKAEGSPFFTEEITRGLLEGGYLARENGHHLLTRPLEEVRIPGTVQEVIAARLDRLGADAKRVLQVAAVIGRQFSREQLAQLIAAEGIDVDLALRELERRGIIHRKNLFSDDEFRFGESLTQEVAYESLLLKQRRQLHERIGGLLESAGTGSPERSALLAHHFTHGDDSARAVSALLRAAADAEKVPSYRTAAGFYRRAWDLATSARAGEAGAVDPAALAAAVGLSRMIVIYSVDVEGGEHVAAHARELAAAAGATETLANLCMFQGLMIMSNRERFAEGLALVEQGLAVAQRAGLSLPSLSRGLGWGYLLDGRFDLALRTLAWAVAELDRSGQGECLGDSYLGARSMRARALFCADDLDGAVNEARATYESGVRAGNRTIQSATAATLAQVYFVRGAAAEAKSWADRSVEVAHALGGLGSMRAEAAIALAAGAELRAPVATARYLDMIAQEATPEGLPTLGCHLMTDALLEIGEWQHAERLARMACQHASGRLREMLGLLSLADVLRAQDREHWDEADRCYERAIELGETLGARTVLAAARLGAAALAARRADTEGSVHHLEQTLAISRELGLGRYEQRAARLLAELSASRPAEGVRTSDHVHENVRRSG